MGVGMKYFIKLLHALPAQQDFPDYIHGRIIRYKKCIITKNLHNVIVLNTCSD